MSAKKAKEPKPKRMSKRQYLNALDQLGLTIAGKATAKALGLSLRQCMRLSSGDVPVPTPVEKLLQMYLKYGLPDDAA
jgi:hypothetical protein